jgi:membrane-associated phospholipid phosphatase
MRPLLLLVLIALVPRPAHAAEAQPPLFVREEIDLPLTLAFGTVWLMTELTLKDEFSAGAFDPLTYDAIGQADRGAIGNWNPSAAEASDVLLYGAFALPLLINGIDDIAWGSSRHAPGSWFWTDAVIAMETLFFAGALTNLTKWAFTRYRPYMYILGADPETHASILAGSGADRLAYEEALEDPDAALSFWSGHTALAFSAMFATASLLTYKHLDDHPGPLFVMWGGALAMGVTVGILRVQSGKHFPSDVMAGAIIGAATGIVIPALHRRRGSPPPVVFAPHAGPDGGGLSVMARW